ncbi:MAG: hypothetical protein IJT19_05560 [Bacteroidaceae bacterium]|nr:hypothetical protein [Bacteroidaceae bacterium]
MDIHYIFQVLCLLTLVAVPLSLSKKHFHRITRLLLALFPVIFGLAYYLITRETNGIFVALIGLWAVFFVAVHPRKREESED